MNSILQDVKECYITKSPIGLHKHHLFFGANRKNSERYGLWVYLRWDWHNGRKYGVHFNKEMGERLKQDGQRAFEQLRSRDEFVKVFGRNYL